MSTRKALELCPHAIVVFPRFEVYKSVSTAIRQIFNRYTDLIEPLSLDEAYLDVSADKMGIGSAIEIAEQIRKAIRDELNLTASAGVSSNKFIAKIASGMNKPDGLTFIAPSKIIDFIERLPVEKFSGVGKVTAAKMKSLQLFTGADLKKLSEDELVNYFGKSGHFYFRIVRGIDDRDVQPHRATKSLAAEDTFLHDLSELSDMHMELQKLAGKVAGRLEKYQLQGRTITLKIRFSDFKSITRNHSFQERVSGVEVLFETARLLLDKAEINNRKVRLLGISVSNFEALEKKEKPGNSKQLKLFKD
jgi:DNA polymerase-4